MGHTGTLLPFSHSTDLLLDITTFFEGPESDRFATWWTDLTQEGRLEMMVKARQLILTVRVRARACVRAYDTACQLGL
jgi:hypothetical protein